MEKTEETTALPPQSTSQPSAPPQPPPLSRDPWLFLGLDRRTVLSAIDNGMPRDTVDNIDKQIQEHREMIIDYHPTGAGTGNQGGVGSGFGDEIPTETFADAEAVAPPAAATDANANFENKMRAVAEMTGLLDAWETDGSRADESLGGGGRAGESLGGGGSGGETEKTADTSIFGRISSGYVLDALRNGYPKKMILEMIDGLISMKALSHPDVVQMRCLVEHWEEFYLLGRNQEAAAGTGDVTPPPPLEGLNLPEDVVKQAMAKGMRKQDLLMLDWTAASVRKASEKIIKDLEKQYQYDPSPAQVVTYGAPDPLAGVRVHAGCGVEMYETPEETEERLRRVSHKNKSKKKKKSARK